MLRMSVPRAGTTRFAARGHHRLSFETAGSGAVDAPVVVLLHGLLGGRGELVAQRDALAAGYRVVLPEARGHGASAALANQRYAVADMAAEILAILDAEEIARAHLVGHDLGGAAAFELTRTHPNRVRSLTLIEPALSVVLDDDADPAAVTARADARRADRAAADAAYKGLTDRSLDLYLDRRWGRGWRDWLSRPRLAAIRRHAGALAATLAALDAYTVDPAALAAMALPVLVVHGADAPSIVRLTCEHLAASVPHARLDTVPSGVEGDPPLSGEAGAALNATLLAFLVEVEGTGT